MAETTTGTGFAQQDAGVFPPLATDTYPSQLLWLVITFGLFYYLMSRYALPRISSILEVRKDRVAADLDEANRLDEEGKAAIAAYEQDLATARSNAQGIAQKARDAAKAEADASRATAEADLNQRIAASESSIAETRAKAMAEVDRIAEETAEALVRTLAPAKVTKAEIEAAVASVSPNRS